MRFLFIAVLLLQTLLLQAQSDSIRYTASKIIVLDSMGAEELYSQSRLFTANNAEKFFMTNDRVKDRKWVMGRAKWGNPMLKKPGLDYAYDEGKLIVAHCLFGYQSSDEGCLRLLIVTADVTMNFKDGKAKITLSNYKYAHYNMSSPPTAMTLHANETCNAEGTLEDLEHCNACKIATTNAVNFVKQRSQELIGAYEQSLKKYVTATNVW